MNIQSNIHWHHFFKSCKAKAKTVVVIGGGLSGLACGKYLSDAGHKAARKPRFKVTALDTSSAGFCLDTEVVLEARDVLGGKAGDPNESKSQRSRVF